MLASSPRDPDHHLLACLPLVPDETNDENIKTREDFEHEGMMDADAIELVEGKRLHHTDGNGEHPQTLLQKVIHQKYFQNAMSDQVDRAESLGTDLQVAHERHEHRRYGIVGISGEFLLRERNDQSVQLFGTRDEEKKTSHELEKTVDAFDDHAGFEEPVQETPTLWPLVHTRFMVPRRGLEPPRDCSRYHLKVVRLPFRHLGMLYISKEQSREIVARV